MKTIKLILKGILLYTTVIVIMLFICGVDSIYDAGLFHWSVGIILGLIYLCWVTLTEEDIDKLTFTKKVDEDYEDFFNDYDEK